MLGCNGGCGLSSCFLVVYYFPMLRIALSLLFYCSVANGPVSYRTSICAG